MDFKENVPTQFTPIEDMEKKAAQEETAALREGIDHHDYLYYVKNQPAISDAEYDRLFRRLQRLEDVFPDLRTENSPTRRVGAEPVDELVKIDHAAPMLSLNAVYNKEEFNNFHDFVCRQSNSRHVDYVLEPKFDGFSVEIVYRKAAFQYGATRGNGRTGEDVSANLKTIRSLPLQLQQAASVPSYLSVRGEVFMQKEGFQRLNQERIEKGLDPFANPRNAAAGTMRQLDPGKVAVRPLDIFFYDILRLEGAFFSSHWEALRQMEKWGLKTDPHNRRGASADDVRAYHRRLSAAREDLAYEIDGIVVKLDSYELRERLGTRHRSPRWALAWKFEPKEDVTILEKIVVQVGRTGILTPVALLQPVNIGGVTVSRATLHNADEVRKKDLRPGDAVRVVRAGDVIPEIEQRVEQRGKKRGRPFRMPSTCPACGAKIYREGAYYLCPAGLACRPQLTGRLVHYASREALDIDGLGEQTARALAEAELVADIADLYRLSPDELLQLDGFADKSAQKLYEAIQETKTPRLDRFLYALGIRHVGQRTARILAERFKRLDKLKEATCETLQQTGEIGPEIARRVHRFFRQKENRQVLRALKQLGMQVQSMPPSTKPRSLSGKTFVFSGRLKHYTRAQAKDLVEQQGGRAASSISGSTDYLVLGQNPGRKREEARRENVTVIREERFTEMVRTG